MISIQLFFSQVGKDSNVIVLAVHISTEHNVHKNVCVKTVEFVIHKMELVLVHLDILVIYVK
jgi:hypothetical protein